jgi:4'-phosphopantetheinyl transferase EntD
MAAPDPAGTGVIDQILPDWIAVVESREDGFFDELYPAERALMINAVAKRREEFATVRHCARLALTELGFAPAPLLPGERGAPRWPVGVVGSMTHCDGFRAAALASGQRARSIGVDAEPHAALPEGILDAVALPDEQQQLAELASQQPRVYWDRLLFTMKESVYKTWFPLTGRWLDFHQARVRIDPATGSFEAELLVTGPTVDGRELTSFSGRYLIGSGLAMSAIVIEAPGSAVG